MDRIRCPGCMKEKQQRTALGSILCGIMEEIPLGISAGLLVA